MKAGSTWASITTIKVPDEELASVAIERDPFHGEWDCAIRPRGLPKG